MLDGIGIKDPAEKLNLYILFGGTVYYYRLVEKMISDYPEIGSWWSRKGDEMIFVELITWEEKPWQLRSRIKHWVRARQERSWS